MHRDFEKFTEAVAGVSVRWGQWQCGIGRVHKRHRNEALHVRLVLGQVLAKFILYRRREVWTSASIVVFFVVVIKGVVSVY